MLAVWILVVILSIVVPLLTPKTGDGFTRGMNRIGLFLSFQGVAGLVALASAALSRSVRKDSPRLAVLGWIPLATSGLLVLGILLLILWARS